MKKTIWQLLLTISSVFLALLCLSNISTNHILRFTGISLLITLVTMFIFVNFVDTKYTKKRIIISSIFSMYYLNILQEFNYNKINNLLELVGNIVHHNLENYTSKVLPMICFMAIFSLIYFINIIIEKIYPKVLDFAKSLTKVEKKYFLLIAIIGSLAAISISYFTTAFYKPTRDKEEVNYDVIYTSDTGALTRTDVFTNPSADENDIRQPLFGVFAAPFGIAAHLMSEVLVFVPKDLAFPTSLAIIQILLLAIANILVARLLKIKEKDKKYFYALITTSFPFLLFSLLIEQYVIAVFYLVLFIYNYFNSNNETNYLYLTSTGTLLTSGILFGMIPKSKDIKVIIKRLFTTFLLFSSIYIIFGRHLDLFVIQEKIKKLSEFAFVSSLSYGLKQFTVFIQSIFIAPKAHLVSAWGVNSYQLTEPTFSIIGIVLFIIVTISVVLNRKNKFAILSYIWVIFSILILLVLGWGSCENGMILYTLYFSWAYIALFYLFIKSLFKKYYNNILMIFICLFSILNIYGFAKLLLFAFIYY